MWILTVIGLGRPSRPAATEALSIWVTHHQSATRPVGYCHPGMLRRVSYRVALSCGPAPSRTIARSRCSLRAAGLELIYLITTTSPTTAEEGLGEPVGRTARVRLSVLEYELVDPRHRHSRFRPGPREPPDPSKIGSASTRRRPHRSLRFEERTQRIMPISVPASCSGEPLAAVSCSAPP